VVRQANPDARFEIRREDVLVCVEATAPVRLGIVVGLTIRATACALDDVQASSPPS
jgi:hypothetical protein